LSNEQPRDDFPAAANDVDARNSDGPAAGPADDAQGAAANAEASDPAGERGRRRSLFNRRRGPRRGPRAAASEGDAPAGMAPQAEPRAEPGPSAEAEPGQPRRAAADEAEAAVGGSAGVPGDEASPRGPREGAPRRGRKGRGRRAEGEGPERGPRSEGATAERAPRPDADPLPAWAAGRAVGLDALEARKRPQPGRTELLSDEDHPKLHKVLADAGLGSRRDMEELIIAGRVSVNGQPAHIGQRIGPNDQVRANGRPIPRRNVQMPPRVLLYHKPSGEICTRDDPNHRATVFERLPRLKGARWVAVGRLDFNTEGLLILTTSGDIANKLMHPRYGWEREYAVRVLGRIDDEKRARLLAGVELDDGPAKFSAIEDLGGDGANAWYRVVISEGRNREVRRMFDAVELTVSRLARLRFGPVALPRGLSRGRWIELGAADVAELLKLLREAGGDAEPRPVDDDDFPLHADDDEWSDDYEHPADSIGNRAEPEEERQLAPHEVDDEWQPSSSTAHLEGITRKVRSGDGLPKPVRPPRRARPGARGQGGGGGVFTGPMDHARGGGFTPGFEAPGGKRSGEGGRGRKGKAGPGGARGGKPGGQPGQPGARSGGQPGGKPGRGGPRPAQAGSQPGQSRGPGSKRGPGARSGQGGQGAQGQGGAPGGQRRGGRRGGSGGGTPGGAA
jgi:23S rRNA pseudouridine2605 synthase